MAFVGQALCLKEGLNLGFKVEAWFENEGTLHFEDLGAPEEGAFAPSSEEVKYFHL